MNYLISCFSILHRQSDVFLSRRLTDLGINATQFAYLMCLSENPGSSQEQLSSLMRIDKGSVSKSIRLLTDQGYITHTISETDKRQYRLYPSEKTIALLPRFHEIVMEYENYMTRELTPIEADILRSLLEKLVKNV